MGLTSSKYKHGSIKTVCREQIDQFYMFQKFMREHVELQSSSEYANGTPWVTSFSEISAAYYTYLYDYVKYPRPSEYFTGFDEIVYSLIKHCIKLYKSHNETQHIAMWGFVVGVGYDRKFNSVMISGLRLAKIPTGTLKIIYEDTTL